MTLLRTAQQTYLESQYIAAHEPSGQYKSLMQSIIDGFYAEHRGKTIFDKNRAWPIPYNLDMLSEIQGVPPKIICTVRPIADVLASWVRILKTADNRSKIDEERERRGFPATDEGICRFLMSRDGNVMQAWAAMKEAYESKWREHMLFIEYDDLIEAPQAQLDRIHDFIGLDHYPYRFDAIEAAQQEDDVKAYGVAGLHAVRPRLEKTAPDAETVLGPKLCAAWRGGRFWTGIPDPPDPPAIIDLQLQASLKGDFATGALLAQLAAPDDDRAQFNKGWYLIRDGHLNAGMKLLDRGRAGNFYGSGIPSKMPIWDGRQLNGETVLLNLECGQGDQICHARFATDIALRGGRVVMACNPGLAPILSRIKGVSAVVQSEAASGVYHQTWVPAMSAAHILGYEWDDIDGKPYLPCASSTPNAKLRIGIRWAGDPGMMHDEFRRFDPANLWDLASDDIQLVSLQRDWDGEVPSFIRRPSLATWEKTAEVIAGLDLVISSCTGVAHLAAAMGKPTWIIVPILPYYLWSLPRDTSPWYDTVRLFRQTAYKDWGECFERLREAFESWLSERR